MLKCASFKNPKKAGKIWTDRLASGVRKVLRWLSGEMNGRRREAHNHKKNDWQTIVFQFKFMCFDLLSIWYLKNSFFIQQWRHCKFGRGVLTFSTVEKDARIRRKHNWQPEIKFSISKSINAGYSHGQLWRFFPENKLLKHITSRALVKVKIVANQEKIH